MQKIKNELLNRAPPQSKDPYLFDPETESPSMTSIRQHSGSQVDLFVYRRRWQLVGVFPVYGLAGSIAGAKSHDVIVILHTSVQTTLREPCNLC